MSSIAKIRSSSAAAEWRRDVAAPVVFTNGVFDLLHAGHVELLEQARALGNALIVAINSDASAARLGKRGPARPLVPIADRARVVAALACVDCVVVFDEDTPLASIEALNPDVLVKGGDYTEAQVVGAEFVRAHNGRVVIVPLVPGHSTTQLAERLRATP